MQQLTPLVFTSNLFMFQNVSVVNARIYQLRSNQKPKSSIIFPSLSYFHLGQDIINYLSILTIVVPHLSARICNRSVHRDEELRFLGQLLDSIKVENYEILVKIDIQQNIR
ncbi:unnamed protein product [Mucor hiemalis]